MKVTCFMVVLDRPARAAWYTRATGTEEQAVGNVTLRRLLISFLQLDVYLNGETM